MSFEGPSIFSAPEFGQSFLRWNTDIKESCSLDFSIVALAQDTVYDIVGTSTLDSDVCRSDFR